MAFKGLIRGNEKAVLDITFPKMVIANTKKFICFYNERRKRLRNVYHTFLADRSGRR